MSQHQELPAILGGLPIRPEGPPTWPPRDPDVSAALQRAAADGAWGHYIGPAADELRDLLKSVHEVEHVWLCSSGTAAVEFALRGVGVGPGDEVILAAYDFKANFSDVLALGATPVLVDLRPDDWQINTSHIAQAVSPQTKAVIATHLHGGGVDLDGLRNQIGDRPVAVIEDACQCPGAWIGGRRAGTIGDVGVLSFGGSKLTAAGRGGAVLSRQVNVIERIKRHAMRGNDLSPLSELQAAVLVPQWRQLDERNRQRAESVRKLEELLRSFPALRFLTPLSSATATGYYKVGFEYDSNAMHGLSRDHFCRAMRAEGIAMSPGFRSLHRIHATRRFRTPGPLPVADKVDERIVVLHHPVLLEGPEAIGQIAEAVTRIREHAPTIRQNVPDAPSAIEFNDE